MYKKLFIRLSISLVTIVITLVGIEVMVRWGHLYPDNLSTFDPEVGDVFVAGASGVRLNPGCWGDYRQFVEINSKGLRDLDITYHRTEILRILVLGDSFAVAQEVELSDTFHQILEADLGIEIVVGAHGGWGTDNELLWYKAEGYKYNPDLVLLLFQPGNDVQDNSVKINYVPDQVPYFVLENEQLVLKKTHQGGETRRTSQLGGLLHEYLLEHSRLYSLFLFRMLRQQLVDGTVYKTNTSGDGDEPSADWEDSYQYQYDQAFKLTLRILDELSREVQSDGADFVIAVASSDKQIFLGGDNSEFTTAFQSRGFDVIDLLPALSTAHENGVEVHFDCDGHWNPNGHSIVAKTLEPYLLDWVLAKE